MHPAGGPVRDSVRGGFVPCRGASGADRPDVGPPEHLEDLVHGVCWGSDLVRTAPVPLWIGGDDPDSVVCLGDHTPPLRAMIVRLDLAVPDGASVRFANARSRNPLR